MTAGKTLRSGTVRGRVFLATAVLACVLAPAAGAARDGGNADSIHRFLDRTLPAGAGGSLVVASGDDRVYCRGFGRADRENGVAAGCRTVYDVMSMTKQFTAAAIMKLAMDGQLELGDRIARHLGPVPADKRTITIRRLLTHTSGLPGAIGGDYERTSRKGLIEGAMRSPLRSRPGRTYHYSNTGYSLLAAIVEEASGMGYEEFLASALFGPAGMTDTGYVLPDWDRDQVAVEYDPRGRPQGRPMDHPWAADGPYWNLRGNGGLLSSARDMFRWHRALEGDEILDDHAKAQMFEPRVREEPEGDSFYGYGWALIGSPYGPVAWHNGGNGWSYGELTRILEPGVTVFWVTNRSRNAQAGWSLDRLGNRLTRGVAERALGGGAG